MEKIPDKTIDLVVTDPPYFLDSFDNNWNEQKIQDNFKQAKTVKNLPAGMRFHRKQADKLQEFYQEVASDIFRVLKPGAFFLSFSQPRLSFAIAQAVHTVGFEVRDIYTWYYRNKSQSKAFSQDHFIRKMKISEEKKKALLASIEGRKTPQLRPQTELIVMGQKPREGTFVENWERYHTGLVNLNTHLKDNEFPSTLMHVEKSQRKTYNTHLTVKPVELITHLIEIFSAEKQLILDPFLGSGTTAIAALETGRHYLGIEKNQNYLKIAEKRIAEWGS